MAAIARKPAAKIAKVILTGVFIWNPDVHERCSHETLDDCNASVLQLVVAQCRSSDLVEGPLGYAVDCHVVLFLMGVGSHEAFTAGGVNSMPSIVFRARDIVRMVQQLWWTT